MKSTGRQALKWLAGAGLVAAVVGLNWDRFRDVGTQWDQFDPWQLVVAGLIFLAASILTFFRWFILVRAQALPFRFVDAMRLGFVSLFFSSFLPGSIGGDLVKAGFLAREQSRRTVAIATILVDRFIGLYGLFLLASLVGLVYWEQTSAAVDAKGATPLRVIVYLSWGVAVGGFLAVALVAVLPIKGEPWLRWLERLPRIGHVLVELAHAFRTYRANLAAVALATLIALVGHVGFVLCFYFAARAVPPPIPTLEQHGLLVPVGMVVESVPLTPGGLGVGEATYEYLYHLVDQYDQFKGKGILAKLGQRVVIWGVALIGLGCYLPLRGTVRQIMAEEEATPPGGQP